MCSILGFVACSNGTVVELEIFVDGTTTEVFANGGERALSSITFDALDLPIGLLFEYGDLLWLPFAYIDYE